MERSVRKRGQEIEPRHRQLILTVREVSPVRMACKPAFLQGRFGEETGNQADRKD